MSSDANFDKLLHRIKVLEERVAKLETQTVHVSTEDQVIKNKAQSLREYINEKQPKTANDHGLVIGYFIETIKQQGSFNIDDLRNGFRDAKIPAPQNISDMVNKNIAKGYIMVDTSQPGPKRSWVLTNSGEKKIEAGLGKDK